MKRSQALQVARLLMNQQGLSAWLLRIDSAKQRCGSCNYTKREISLSRHFIELNSDAEVRNTILHEIAHAQVGPGHAHDPIWQRAVARLGARIESCAGSQTEMPQPKWGLQCLNCQQVIGYRHRRALKLNQIRCRTCGSDKGKLSWVATANA